MLGKLLESLLISVLLAVLMVLVIPQTVFWVMGLVVISPLVMIGSVTIFVARWHRCFKRS